MSIVVSLPPHAQSVNAAVGGYATMGRSPSPRKEEDNGHGLSSARVGVTKAGDGETFAEMPPPPLYETQRKRRRVLEKVHPSLHALIFFSSPLPQERGRKRDPELREIKGVGGGGKSRKKGKRHPDHCSQPLFFPPPPANGGGSPPSTLPIRAASQGTSQETRRRRKRKLDALPPSFFPPSIWNPPNKKLLYSLPDGSSSSSS